MNAGRFDVLDSWRGICACLVALFHFETFSHLTYWSFVRNAWLFVDFFFVLSGFVIVANYRERLAAGFGVGRFLGLRLGRVYPLHVAMMVPFIVVEIGKIGIGSELVRAVTTNALLIHALGVNEKLWLNFPSWSISAEFATYVVFAVFATLGRGRFWGAFVLVALIVSPLILGLHSPQGINATTDYAFFRSLYGFALGAVCHELWRRVAFLRRSGAPWIATVAEVGSVVLAGVAVATIGHTMPAGLVIPPIFALVVLVFARQAGALSRLLSTRPLVFVGTLSYSIYMVHALVRVAARVGAAGLERSGIDAMIEVTLPGLVFYPVPNVGGSLWLGDLLMAVMLAVTIGLAALAHRLIEEPGRQWSRRVVAAMPSTSARPSSAG